MKTCDKCSNALWKKTANGRLHPNKQGVCVVDVPPVPVLPNSRYWGWSYNEKAPVPNGGRIERGHKYEHNCPYWSAAK